MIIQSITKSLAVSGAIALMLGLTACGGGGSKQEYPTSSRYDSQRPGVADAASTSSARTKSQGVFLDSPVVGLQYRIGKLTARTDANGAFNYAADDNIEFFYGSISFGSSAANSLVTPLNLSKDSNVVINQLRLLQTLDVDGDPSNGILLPDAELVPEDLTINFAQDTISFSKDPNVIALLSATSNVTTLVTAEAAQAHFNQSLENYKSTAR